MEEVLGYILKSSCILTLFYIVYRFLLIKETFFTFNRLYLIVGFLSSVLLPLLTYTQVRVVELSNTFKNSQNYIAVSSIQDQGALLNVVDILASIYIIGVLYMIFRFSVQLLHLSKVLRTKKYYSSAGIKHIQKKGITNPFTFFNYIVYDPQQHDVEELELILSHEKQHVYQRHSIDVLIARSILIFQWYNPIAWLYAKRVIENLEYLADDAVVNTLEESKTYQLAMLRVSTGNVFPPLVNSFYQSFIKKRIIMLNKKSSRQIMKVKVLALLPLIAVFMLSFNIKEKVIYTTSQAKEKKGSTTETSSLQTYAETTQPEVNGTQETYKVVIKNTMSKEEIDALIQTVKTKYNLDIEYTKLKYNDAGKISSLKIKTQDGEGNSGNYAFSSTNGINDIVIYRDKTGAVGVSSIAQSEKFDTQQRKEAIEQRRAAREEELASRKKEMQARLEERKAVMEVRKEEMQIRMQEQKEKREDISEEIKNRKIDVRKKSMSEYERDLVQDVPETILFVIDGELSTRDELSKLQPNDIESINVLKSQKARDKYGDKLGDKEGVIEVNTKKN